jgi:ATP-dependent RNA helicase DeaD
MTEFEGVLPALARALANREYTDLTPVQKAVVAPEVRDADILVSAQTGSGKTVAFGLAMGPTILDGAERFSPSNTPLTLAVAPTRELALQVKRELEWLYQETGASIASCVGGMDMRTEIRALNRGAHIVVGTPGRLRDHIERGSLDTSGLKVAILDEADEMLDMGFRDDLEYILSSAPAERRTLMFSATVPRTIANLAKRYQRNAVRISTSEEKAQHIDIEYQALVVAPTDRENAIINVLRFFDAKTALVFCATRATVNHMTSRFNNRGFPVVALSGELSQNQRTQALQAMRDGRARVCIATDVAARGIDLPNLDLVIHADIPKNSEGLLHRSGRTGRAGRKGVSVLIVPHNARRRTERLLQSANVVAKWEKPPSVDDILQRDRERILGDPSLSEPLSEEEATFAQEILALHGPEQIAAAFLRQHLAGQTAPEELLDAASAPESKPKRRDDFKNGVWFSLSVGHKHSAEARWLLPMLCRAGNITKNDIGAIKVHQAETHVELAPACVGRFLEALGLDGTIEKNVNVVRLEGIPAASADTGSRKPADRAGSYQKRDFSRKDSAAPADKKPYEKRKPSADAKPYQKKDYAQKDNAAPADEKPYEKRKPSADAKPYQKRDYAQKDSAAPGNEKPYKKRNSDTDAAPYQKPDYSQKTSEPTYNPASDKKSYASGKPDAPRAPDANATSEPKRGFSQRDDSTSGDEKPYKKRKPDPSAALDPKRGFSKRGNTGTGAGKQGPKKPWEKKPTGKNKTWNKNPKQSKHGKPFQNKFSKPGGKKPDAPTLSLRKPK